MLRVSLAVTCLTTLFSFSVDHAGPWIAPDWQDREPGYTPGSLFWKTHEYPTCPIIYRSIVDIGSESIQFAALQGRCEDFAYVFLNGKRIAEFVAHQDADAPLAFEVELTPQLQPGRNVLMVSTTAHGLALAGAIAYQNGKIQHVSSETQNWRTQKLPPLTMVEFHPCAQPDFNDHDWFAVREMDRESMMVEAADLENRCAQLAVKRLRQQDEDARWRLTMLKDKGIAIADWNASSWGGNFRLPEWVRQQADRALSTGGEPGELHDAAEALTRYVLLRDEVTNLENQVVGMQSLDMATQRLADVGEALETLRSALAELELQLQSGGHYQDVIPMITRLEAVRQRLRHTGYMSPLCRNFDNKFGWFDTNALLENDIADWGLQISSDAGVFASPLSPAALISVGGSELHFQGWDTLKPLRVYNKPPKLGPIGIWVVLDGKVIHLQPNDAGVVYDRAIHGAMSENWMLLVHDLSAGGHLPIELVFLEPPGRVRFESNEGDTTAVSFSFTSEHTRLFVLRPLKEWRGLLQQARVMNAVPLDEGAASTVIGQCRLWSRALLNYPVTFSEVFTRDPQYANELLVADVYNYREFEDAWNTEPLRIAPLPPLATYGLMTQYPGLEVVSPAEKLGSHGIWGDHIAAVGQDHIVYRLPLEPIKRFGGFTAYCFGPTDIGEPGSLTEIKTILATGANTFRPQHNQTGDRAMKTLEWCWERGIQNVFNTDEKWVPDVVEHFRVLAEKCKDYPPDAVAYDLLNEPETRQPRAYNALIKKVTAAIREVDTTHLIYVETMPPWGPGAAPFPQGAFETLEPTGDERTVYSFHDYEYRLPPRWPNQEHDIRDILKRWIPAFRFSIDAHRPIHLGEFGGFEQTKENVYTNPCALTLMMDYLNIFDQFGWHWHYYANRGTVRVHRDGSLQDSYVQEAHRRYFQRGSFNINR